MLLQTNSYVVPKDKRAEHARLLRKFRQTLSRLGCDHFEAYEQVGANWSNGETTGRFVQIMRFRDRKHQVSVQAAERSDPGAQQLIAEFCELINFPYQQQQGLFAVGFYTSALPVAPARGESVVAGEQPPMPAETGEEIPAPPADELREVNGEDAPGSVEDDPMSIRRPGGDIAAGATEQAQGDPSASGENEPRAEN